MKVNRDKYWWITKFKFIDMYGGKCACCGEDNPQFLSLDHVEEDGKEDILAFKMNRYQLYKNATASYQSEKYQLLCYNCNLGKSTNGGVCPHRTGRLHNYSKLREDQLQKGGTDSGES